MVQERPAFGRRTTALQVGTGASALSVRPTVVRLAAPTPTTSRPDEWSAATDPLSPEAEAFRRDMRDGPKSTDKQFDDWRRSQSLGRFLSVVLRVALMSPGALCFFLHAPSSLSFGLEVAGFALGWWLKRARKRYHRTIVDWKDPLDGPAV